MASVIYILLQVLILEIPVNMGSFGMREHTLFQDFNLLCNQFTWVKSWETVCSFVTGWFQARSGFLT